ncbi:MAG: hypothetical protein WA116_07330 [Anaerolineaceae bacterium]
MKKYLILLIPVLLLSACNMPSNATATPDLIATNVSQALTNAPTNTSVVLTEPVIVTATEVATIETTAAPSEALTQVPTTEPTLPPTVTATSTALPAPTATFSPEDPAIRYGNPTKTDDFSTSSATWNYEDDWSTLNVNNGQLNIYSKGTPYWNSWYTIGPAIQNFYLETTLSIPNCNSGDRIGLAFRLSEDNAYYFMGLTCDGTWGFSRYTSSNETQTILAYESSDQLKPIGEQNRLGVLANGDAFEFYLNGVKVGATTDSSYPKAGTYGFVTMSAGTLNFRTSVDNLKYWLLP